MSIKGWKTSAIGIGLLIGLIHTATTKGFSIQEVISGLISIGFLLSKDYDKTHSDK